LGDGWKILGATLQRTGGEALAAIQRSVELMPYSAEAHYNLGIALYALGRLDAAASSYRRALEIRPDYVEAHNNLGNVLKDQRDQEGH